MGVQELISYLLTPVAQVALIMGLAEVAKRFGLTSKWIPLLDISLGILSGTCVYGAKYGAVQSVILGIALGLSACGLFSGIKNTLEDR